MAIARIISILLLLTPALAVMPALAWAEPYLAAREGLACSNCHVNPTGGGLRTVFGNAYSQQQLAAAPLAADAPAWTGLLAERIALGANARAAARQTELDDRDDNLDFGVDRVSLYLGADLGRASLYVDQQVAPGGSLNREAWGKLDLGAWYIKAGRMFLPFGWRLEDDSAFVREVTGVTMTQGDDGLEVGFESAGVSWQLAATNGNGGGPEVDDGKLFSTRAALIRPGWQAGISAYRNDTDDAERTILGAFLGVRTGPVTWLAEFDQVEDEIDAAAGEQQQGVALLEANVTVWDGHNLKLTAEGLLPDDDGDDVEDVYRFSAVYEYFPWAFTQVRLGVRVLDSDDPAAELNGEEAFVQLHLFF
jgi:hypothetical protein